jgi:hypothetical protein
MNQSNLQRENHNKSHDISISSSKGSRSGAASSKAKERQIIRQLQTENQDYGKVLRNSNRKMANSGARTIDASVKQTQERRNKNHSYSR